MGSRWLCWITGRHVTIPGGSSFRVEKQPRQAWPERNAQKYPPPNDLAREHHSSAPLFDARQSILSGANYQRSKVCWATRGHKVTSLTARVSRRRWASHFPFFGARILVAPAQ
jgi:hypothetical protein